ncbi:MAG: hypothetical protein B7Y45_04470 [Sphingomonas sp. 28-66-16]|nr:MAG: hypothetical protein B7Y45_04470 [Sphingomonas sp. 28-66-16]
MTGCAIGQRVKAPAGPATVVSIQGSACTVRVDGRPYTDVYAAFMLDALEAPAPSPSRASPPATATNGTAPGGNPKPGLYQCFGGPAGNLKLRFLGGNGYANEQGVKGSFAPGRDGQIKFVSGPWKGFFGKVLAHGRIGLTSVDGGSFYNLTCDPR